MRAEVTGLFVYPLKGAKGFGLPEALVDARGFVHDRRFVLVNPEGRFVTQREVARLGLVEATLVGGYATATALRLRIPGHAPIDLPFASAEPRRRQLVRVWDDDVEAELVEGADGALSAWLGLPVRLARQCGRRPVDPRYASATDEVSFADGFSLLLASEASCSALGDALGEHVAMERFRPNVVVRGLGPWEEEDLHLAGELLLGELGVRAVKPCARCVVVNVDPLTGDTGREPLATLARLRAKGGRVPFGQNLVHRFAAGARVRVGDLLRAARATEELAHRSNPS